MKKTRSHPIDKNTIGGRRETTHDPRYEGVGETNMSENELQVGLTSLIKSFGKIYLKDNEIFILFLD